MLLKCTLKVLDVLFTVLLQYINYKRNELLIYETNEEKVLLEKETIQLKPDNLTINNCQRSGNTVSLQS